MRHISRKKIIIIFCLTIAAIWIVRVCDVKRRFPPKQIEEYTVGERLEYHPRIKEYISADVSMTPVDLTIYTGDKFLQKYSDMEDEYKGYKKFNSCYVIVPAFEVTNNGTETIKSSFLTLFFEVVNLRNGYDNGLMIINPVYIDPGETKTIYMSTLAPTQKYIGAENWDEFINGDFMIIIQQYPLEKRMVYSSDVIKHVE